MKTEWKSPNAIFPMAAESDADFPYSEREDFALPVDYKPTKYDVINGRGKKSYNHIANRRFRQLTAMNLRRYQKSTCKVDKTMIVIGIVNSIRSSSPMGGFIKKDRVTGRWISMSDEGAREKVGHCLRDMGQSQREEKKRAAERMEAENATKRRSGSANPDDVSTLFASFPKIPAFLQPPRVQARSTEQNKGLAFLASSRNAPSSSRHEIPPQAAVYDYPHPAVSMPNAVMAAAMMVPPGMNPYFLGHPGFYPPPRMPPPMADVQQIASTFNNFDYEATTSQTGQAMSEQQQRILTLLENGFKGSVEELIETVGR